MTAVTDLDRLVLWRAAGPALVRTTVATGAAEPVLAVSDALTRAADVVIEGRDLPALQRLSDFVQHLVRAEATSSNARSVAVELARSLGGRRAIDLYIAAVVWTEPAAAAELIGAAAAIADGVLVGHPARKLDERQFTMRGVDEADLLAIVDALPGAPAAALAALAIVGRAGADANWTAPWRARLATLRSNTDPGVRSAALDVFTAGE